MRLLCTTLGLLLPILMGATDVVRAQAPNILLIVADDLGLGDLGAYGQRRIRTPNLDRLANEGVVFERAYASAPVCAPSRCGILTGLDSMSCPVRENTYPEAALPAAMPTIARTLRSLGYRTGFFGKWGLGGELRDGSPNEPQSVPWHMGFERAFAVLSAENAQSHSPVWLWTEHGRSRYQGRYVDDDIVEQASLFMQPTSAPFFAYVALTAPHRAFVDVDAAAGESSRSNGACIRYPDVPRVECAYASMIERLDAHVGRLAQRLRESSRSTLLLFTSDNGAVSVDGHSALFWNSTAGLLGEKRTLLEGGIRVPLILSGSTRGVRAPGAVNLADLPSTFLHAATGIENSRSLLAHQAAQARSMRFEVLDGVHERALISGTQKFRCVYGAQTLCSESDVRDESVTTAVADVDFGPQSPSTFSDPELWVEAGASRVVGCAATSPTRACFRVTRTDEKLLFRISIPQGPYDVRLVGARLVDTRIRFGREEMSFVGARGRGSWQVLLKPSEHAVFGAVAQTVVLIANRTSARESRGRSLAVSLIVAVAVVLLLIASRRRK